jgi:hypothetical protein
VTAAVWAVFTALTCALKFAPAAPAGTITLAGITALALLLKRFTTTPPAGAALAKASVQVTVPAPEMVAGLHDNDDTVQAEERAIEDVLLPPLAVAVTTAVWVVATAVTGAAKVTLAEPAGTVTLAGTARLALLLERLTGTPPAGAELFNETVHEMLPVPTIESGLHANEDT